MEKEIHETSLWLKMSFHKEKWRWEMWMLIYVKTLGELDWLAMVLAKVSQLGWQGTLTSSSPLQLVELGIVHIVNYGGSWMNIILKADWVSKIVLMIRLFFWMFWENVTNHWEVLFIAEWIDFVLFSQISIYFLLCHSQLNLCPQNRQRLEST